MVDTVKTTLVSEASALADADEFVGNQGGATVRGAWTLVATYIASKLWGAWTDYTPTVAASTPAGSGFTTTTTYARYKQVGKTMMVSGQVVITNLGSGPAASGVLSVTLPVAAKYATTGTAYESGALGRSGPGYVSAGASLLDIRGAEAGASWVGLNYNVRFQITYEVA